ncbi:MAG TPA: acyl-CoA synthetase FdrA [bacterium]
MPEIKVEIRRGSYYDSVTLMQLQSQLLRLPGVTNAGVMMGNHANKALLQQNGLLTGEAEQAVETDLIISISAHDAEAAETALARVDDLLSRRRSTGQQDYRPKTLEAAAQMLPDAAWVLVSVPGRYAAGVAKEALRLRKNVFLYSDNVPLDDEISLKKHAAENGLLVMGPDCGTAIINGIGLGFANKIRNGPIGLVGASGTGLQQVTSRIHQLGGGITHALGTGGRDLSAAVGGIAAMQAFDLLLRDDSTKVIVLISKPPAAEVTAKLLQKARQSEKPVVINFIGYSPVKDPSASHIHFVDSLDEAADVAVELSKAKSKIKIPVETKKATPENSRYLRALFSGGTLAYETLLILQNYLPNIYSNIPLKKEQKLPDSLLSREHTILDLGEDEFTVGRPHPMLDNTLRLERFHKEAADPQVGLILLDVVLGYGAHPDPASELAPAIERTLKDAHKNRRLLEVIVLLVGTDEDPQDFSSQLERFKVAGARVETSPSQAAFYIGRYFENSNAPTNWPPVDLQFIQKPVQAINVGLESFQASLSSQGATVVHVDWRPPAGGNEKLMSILERMKKA